jgi:hypothetical protein
MHGPRSKIPSKNLVTQRCAEGINSGVEGLKNSKNLRVLNKNNDFSPAQK